MEMKAPTTTAQPQPPSGGVYPTGPPGAGGMAAHRRKDEKEKRSWAHGGRQVNQRDLKPVGETQQTAAWNHLWYEKARRLLPSKFLAFLAQLLSTARWRKRGLRRGTRSRGARCREYPEKHNSEGATKIFILGSSESTAAVVRKTICASVPTQKAEATRGWMSALLYFPVWVLVQIQSSI